jgi:hypothetical protein
MPRARLARCVARAHTHASSSVRPNAPSPTLPRFPPSCLQYTPAEGTEYCRRKVLLLRENVDKLGEARLSHTHTRTNTNAR